jgi:hypothetical protein
MSLSGLIKKVKDAIWKKVASLFKKQQYTYHRKSWINPNGEIISFLSDVSHEGYAQSKNSSEQEMINDGWLKATEINDTLYLYGGKNINSFDNIGVMQIINGNMGLTRIMAFYANSVFEISINELNGSIQDEIEHQIKIAFKSNEKKATINIENFWIFPNRNIFEVESKYMNHAAWAIAHKDDINKFGTNIWGNPVTRYEIIVNDMLENGFIRISGNDIQIYNLTEEKLNIIKHFYLSHGFTEEDKIRIFRMDNKKYYADKIGDIDISILSMASIIDYPHESLPEDLWDKVDNKYVLKDDIKKDIEQIVGNVLDKNFKNKEKWLKDILIGGSIATNFWIK